MGRRGPPKTSSAENALKGNPGRRPLNELEPMPLPGAPEMPGHFDEVAEAAWHWLCAELAAMFTLATSDLAVMTLYCDTWSEYMEARAMVQEEGMIAWAEKTDKEGEVTRTPYQSPFVNIEAMLKKQLHSYCRELGLSPTSRPGIVAGKPPVDEGAGRFFNAVGA